MIKQLQRVICARLLHVFIILVSFCTSGLAFAQDIQDLQRSNDVEIKAWVGQAPSDEEQSTSPNFSVNEQVILNIEVATPRWFTGGTRIGSVEIPDVIAKQRNQLATNFTERKGGQTWSRQRWEVTLYPQASGNFVIPPIAVGVQVSAPDGNNVSGTLYTQPIQFSASLPSGLLSDNTPWFAATNVDVNQEWESSGESLKVGDAVTRRITITAQDSLSVLLPDLLKGESTSRYQAYPQPHRLSDTQTRGDYQSTRTEESVYVIQQGGELTLPVYEFQWWNSQTQQLETIVVEGKSFQAKHTLASFIKAYFAWIVSIVAIVALSLVLFLAVKRYYRTRPTPPWLRFHQLLKSNRWGEARSALYKQLRVNTSELEMSKVSANESWQKKSQHLQQGERNKSLMKAMWREIQNKQKRFKLKIPKALPELEKLNRRDGIK
ncbi:BatD family protein [Vibrio sp. EA2]|uniref:BatD family protein n=1 Tax=Vibrio sp. EA2 TaxID=3079860 RepID=UPI0029498895|nr:BatD family protein [Vibrio sp. EA2]MDV6250021.1 BatD family protein [Vibrio sp. EA2]